MVRFLACLAMMQRLALLHEMPRPKTVEAISIGLQCANFLIMRQ